MTYIPWENWPGGQVPPEPFWKVAPGLVAEVLRPSNTDAEIDRKLAELFRAGCKLGWVIDPDAKTAKVYTTAKRLEAMGATGVLDGGKVLPGFTLPLVTLFTSPKKRKRR